MESGLPLNINLGGSQGSNGLANATNRPNVNGSISEPHTLLSGSVHPRSPCPRWAPGAISPRVPSTVRDATTGTSRCSRASTSVRLAAAAWSSGLETFNTFNHTQFQNISTTFTDSRFGQVTSTYNPRNVQLGVKLMF